MKGRVSLGQLRERVAFDAPLDDPDGSGGIETGWSERIAKIAAHFRYLRGGEVVQAARLEGRQPVVVTVRVNAWTRQITSDWRMRDLRQVQFDEDGDLVAGVFKVVAPPVLTENRMWLEITCESGVPGQ